MQISETVQKKIKQLPQKAGVYQFVDKNKRIIYIGKAIRLRSRVQSYFRSAANLSDAKRQMVTQVVDIKTVMVDTEAEALLLETMLINKHRPLYNVVMRDEKSFQYIHVSDDFYPTIQTTRTIFTRQQGRFVRKPGYFFGPYTSGKSVKTTLRLLKSIFKHCDSPPKVVRGKVRFPKRPCLEYQMSRCIGPCADAISMSEYQNVFKEIRKFLAGDYIAVYQELVARMKEAAKAEEYERASVLRDQMQAIDRLMIEQKVISSKGDDADYLSLSRSARTAAVNLFAVRKGKIVHSQVFFLQNTQDQSDEEIMQAFVDQYYTATLDKPAAVYLSTESRRGRHRKMLQMGIANAEQALKIRRASFEKYDQQAQSGLQELAVAFKMKKKDLRRIEVYDISNVQGKYAVGSMVVFTDGVADPAQYRKFKIKTVEGANDVASMCEVISRRIGHLPKYQRKGKKEADSLVWAVPDLIILDGGKPQLNAVQVMLTASKQEIPVVSLAKREEEIFIPGQADAIRLKKDSAGLFLIQRMRDQAHRFAIGFYRKRHLQSLIE